MTMKLNKDALAAALRWRNDLHFGAYEKAGADRAGRAKLRRAKGPLDALLEPQTQELIYKVRLASGEDWRWVAREDGEDRLLMRFGALAILLAEAVPQPDEKETRAQKTAARFAVLLGQTSDGSSTSENKDRRWSVSRFGAMMRAWKEPDDFCRHARRALPVLKREPFDVAAFIRDVIGFDGAVQRKWTFDYYGRPQLAAGDGKAGAQESPAAGHDSPEEN